MMTQLWVIMISWENIVGSQSNDPNAQHGQRLQEWGLPQCIFYGTVKNSDPAALTFQFC